MLEEQKCGHGRVTKGQESDMGSASRRCGRKHIAYCEQRPCVFPLPQMMGLGVKGAESKNF